MYPNAQLFLGAYGWESQTTYNVLNALSDEALGQSKAEGHNTAGDIAWHIAVAATYMLNQVGFNINPALAEKPAVLTAAFIRDTYERISAEVKEQAEKKTPEQLAEVYHVFGIMDWSCGQALLVLMHHEIHHRGQLSVLMRQAGLVVPSIYGPTKEMSIDKLKEQSEQG
jgi:uncharacterized damage-inducible protein DinB